MAKKNKQENSPEIDVAEAEFEANFEGAEAAVEESVVEQPAEASVEVDVNVDVKVEIDVDVSVSSHNTKIAIKSLPFRPRGRAGVYRAGGVYVVKAAEAKELIDAGIATLIEDPCAAEVTLPELED